MKECALEVEDSVFWLPVRNGDVVTALFQHSLAFFQHDCDVQVCLVTAEESVDGRLVHDEIEEAVFVLQVPHVHGVPLHLWPCFLVSLKHLLNTNWRNVHVPNVLVALVVHVFANDRIAAAQVQDL